MTYKLWDSEVETHTPNMINMISLLNMFGTSYWDQLMINNIKGEIDDTLFNGIEELYKKQKRKENLDILLEDDDF